MVHFPILELFLNLNITKDVKNLSTNEKVNCLILMPYNNYIQL